MTEPESDILGCALLQGGLPAPVQTRRGGPYAASRAALPHVTHPGSEGVVSCSAHTHASFTDAAWSSRSFCTLLPVQVHFTKLHIMINKSPEPPGLKKRQQTCCWEAKHCGGKYMVISVCTGSPLMTHVNFSCIVTSASQVNKMLDESLTIRHFTNGRTQNLQLHVAARRHKSLQMNSKSPYVYSAGHVQPRQRKECHAQLQHCQMHFDNNECTAAGEKLTRSRPLQEHSVTQAAQSTRITLRFLQSFT